MRKFPIKLFPLLAWMFILLWGCSEEKSPVVPPVVEDSIPVLPPQNVIGVMNAVYPIPSFLLIWTHEEYESVPGFNVYRNKGGDAFLKLNDSPVKFMMFIEDPIMIILGYNDETIEMASRERYRYYLTSVYSTGEESAASDTVSVTPNEAFIYDPIHGLNPNGHFNVNVVPEFSWIPVSGATSYLLHMAGWLYRNESPAAEIIMGDELGVSYFNQLPDRLACGKKYLWSLWAINEHNCAIAAANASFTTMVRTLVDQIDEAGYHCAWWNQLDDQGQAVLPGLYVALIRIDQLYMTVNFTISDTAPPVSAICDPPAGVPQSMSMSSPAEEWPLTEPVLFVYGIPAAAQVQIEIMRGFP